jgi:predicted nucleotidyltransferase
MALPNFNSEGELPEGVHPAQWDEMLGRFGSGSPQREVVTACLTRIFGLVKTTGKLERLVLFGSYVTTKRDPGDVDIILVMRDDFRLKDYDAETRRLFDHQQAAEAFGASVFWVRPSMLFLETLEEFVAHWQIKRDLSRRGIVEIRP